MLHRRAQSERDARSGRQGTNDVVALDSLELIPYLTEEGLITPQDQVRSLTAIVGDSCHVRHFHVAYRGKPFAVLMLHYMQSGAKAVLYAIFDEAKSVKFVGASRNLRSSLLSHLVRVPQSCYW